MTTVKCIHLKVKTNLQNCNPYMSCRMFLTTDAHSLQCALSSELIFLMTDTAPHMAFDIFNRGMNNNVRTLSVFMSKES